MTLAEAMTKLTLESNLTLVIATGALLVSRILPALILSPFLGGDTVPAEVKIGIGLTLAVVLFPGVYPRMGKIPMAAIPYIGLLVKEIFIGLSLAFVLNAIFEAAVAAGTLIDTVSGSNQAQLFIPELQLNASLFANLKTQLTVALFLTLNGHHIVINGLADSLLAVPLHEFPHFSSGLWPFFDNVIRASSKLLSIALALAAPSVLVSLLIEITLGVINRVVPRVQIFFVSLTIRPLAVTMMVLLTIHMIADRIFIEFESVLKLFNEALRLLA